MASECCLSLTKYFLFLFNLMFFLLGSVLLSFGLWIHLSETSYFMPSPPYISIALFSYLLIISGSVTMSLGFLGCLGSLKAVKCLLGMYFCLLTVLLVAQIVGGVLLYTQKTELDSSLKKHTLELINSFGRNDSGLQSFKQTLHYIQHQAKCCGWDGKDDWTDGDVPCSCYYTVNTTDGTHTLDECHGCFNLTHSEQACSVYERGCSEDIQQWLDENLLFILIVILVIALVECLQWISLVSFCCLNWTQRCCARERHGSHVQLSRSPSVTSVWWWRGSVLHEMLRLMHGVGGKYIYYRVLHLALI